MNNRYFNYRSLPTVARRSHQLLAVSRELLRLRRINKSDSLCDFEYAIRSWWPSDAPYAVCKR
jgi:hypothetical protein